MKKQKTRHTSARFATKFVYEVRDLAPGGLYTCFVINATTGKRVRHFETRKLADAFAKMANN